MTKLSKLLKNNRVTPVMQVGEVAEAAKEAVYIDNPAASQLSLRSLLHDGGQRRLVFGAECIEGVTDEGWQWRGGGFGLGNVIRRRCDHRLKELDLQCHTNGRRVARVLAGRGPFQRVQQAFQERVDGIECFVLPWRMSALRVVGRAE